MELEWAMLLEPGREARGLTEDEVERLRHNDTYLLAHTEWVCGAGNETVKRLLDQAAVGMGLVERKDG